MTGTSLADQTVDVLYDVSVALLAREAAQMPEQRENVEATLDNIDPPEPVEQTRREDGMLEHNPDMEIPDWGYMDEGDMPSMWGPTVNASSGAVDGFGPS